MLDQGIDSDSSTSDEEPVPKKSKLFSYIMCAEGGKKIVSKSCFFICKIPFLVMTHSAFGS